MARWEMGESDKWEMRNGNLCGNGQMGKWEGSRGEKHISGQVCPVVIGHASHTSAISFKLFLWTLIYLSVAVHLRYLF